MKFIKTSIFLSFLLISNLTIAQIGRGCLVNGILYTNNTSEGNRYFYRNSGRLYSNCGFVRTGNDGNCRLYNSGPIGNNSSYTRYDDAFSNDWAEITECPIDQNVLVLVSVILLVGCRAVSRYTGTQAMLTV